MITFLFRLWSKQHHDHQYLHHNGPQQQITVNIIHEICFWFQVKLSKPLCINRAQSINHYELCYAKIICLMIHESALCSSIILECFIKALTNCTKYLHSLSILIYELKKKILVFARVHCILCLDNLINLVNW